MSIGDASVRSPLLLSKHRANRARSHLPHGTSRRRPIRSDTWVQWLASSRVLPAAPASLHASFESVSCWRRCSRCSFCPDSPARGGRRPGGFDARRAHDRRRGRRDLEAPRHHEEHDTGEDSGGGPPPSEEREGDGLRKHDRAISIVEAILLAIVALLAAYTGFASAKWGTESSIKLATASAARTEANRAASMRWTPATSTRPPSTHGSRRIWREHEC